MISTKRFGGILSSLFLLTSGVFGSGMRFNVLPRDFPAGRNPFALVVADFNGDGIDDLAVSGSGSVNILLGTGNGLFRKAVAYQVGGGQPWNIVTADFN